MAVPSHAAELVGYRVCRSGYFDLVLDRCAWSQANPKKQVIMSAFAGT
jgi:hypothetical protein